MPGRAVTDPDAAAGLLAFALISVAVAIPEIERGLNQIKGALDGLRRMTPGAMVK